MPVDLFDPDESVRLLLQRVSRLSAHEAARIAEALDNLPLAVAQAAAYLDETGLSAGEYLQHLDTRTAELLPGTLAVATGDPLTFARLTRLLRTRSLARVDTDSLQLHRLVQALLRSRLAGDEAESATAMATVRLLRAVVPPNPWNVAVTWPEWHRLLPHVLTATDPSNALNPEDRDVAWLLDKAAGYLRARGEPAAALPIGRRALELMRQVLGKDDPDTLSAANSLATNLRDLGEYDAARQLDEDTLARRSRVLGVNHRDTLRSANSLAADLRKLGKYEPARQLDEDTLTRSRRVLGEDDPDTLRSANGLATNLRKLGNHDMARQLSEDILMRSRRVLGENHLHTLASATSLAAVLRSLGKHEMARPLDADTLARRRQILGENHPDTLASANNLATDLRSMRLLES